MKEALRLEDEGAPLATAASTVVISDENRNATALSATRWPPNQTLAAQRNGAIFTDTLDRGSGGGDAGHNGIKAQRLAAARASKLGRAEAEAYADVQVRGEGKWCAHAYGGNVIALFASNTYL